MCNLYTDFINKLSIRYLSPAFQFVSLSFKIVVKIHFLNMIRSVVLAPTFYLSLRFKGIVHIDLKIIIFLKLNS